MDLSSLSSVRSAAADFLTRSDKLNVLINNAGMGICPGARSKMALRGRWQPTTGRCLLHYMALEKISSKLHNPVILSRTVVTCSCLGSTAHRISAPRLNLPAASKIRTPSFRVQVLCLRPVPVLHRPSPSHPIISHCPAPPFRRTTG